MNYQRIYDQLINKRIKQPYKFDYHEKHHILPKSCGGSNDKSNIVYLSAREHYIAHLLLVRIYKNNKNFYIKMCYAIGRLMTGNKEFIEKLSNNFNSRLYENIKKEISKIKSERGKKFRHTEESKKKLHDAKLGIKNPSYGKKWYHNPLTMQKKQLSEQEILSEEYKDWIIGRGDTKEQLEYRMKKHKEYFVNKHNKNYIVIYNPLTLDHVYIDKTTKKYTELISNGFVVGSLNDIFRNIATGELKLNEKHNMWIYNDDIKMQKMIYPSLSQYYIQNGWKIGYKNYNNNMGRKTFDITLKTKTKLSKKLKGRIQIYNVQTLKQKQVTQEDLSSYIDSGNWKIGKSPSVKTNAGKIILFNINTKEIKFVDKNDILKYDPQIWKQHYSVRNKNIAQSNEFIL